MDPFTLALRVFCLTVATWVLAYVAAWGVQVWWRKRHCESTDRQLTECHCKLVDAPHDWREHQDWIP